MSDRRRRRFARIGVTMGEYISSCVLDVDARLERSYPGTGSTFKNAEANPADGSAQSAYDFGITDAVFAGNAGTKTGKFTYDGTDNNILAGANPDFVDDWHVDQDFTLFMDFNYVVDNATALFTTKTTTFTKGILTYTLGANNFLNLAQRGGSGASTETGSQALVNGRNIIGISHSHSTNNTRFWVNSATAENVAQTFNADTDPANNPLTILGYNNGTNLAPNGTQLYGFSAFNIYGTDALAAEVIKRYNIRAGT